MSLPHSRRIIAALSLAAVATVIYAADLTVFAPEKSSLSFVSKQMGVPVEGKFRKFDARLVVDPAKPEAGKVQLDIDLASIDAGSKDADDEVKSKNWFNVALFPKASFVSTSVKVLGGGKYEALGKLTLKGTTRDISVPFAVKADAAGALFEGGFTLKRLQFKIGEGVWGDTDTVADDVQIRFKVFARK